MKDIPKGGFLIGIIQRVSGRIFNKKLKKYKIDLNSAQGRILFVLWQHENGENGMFFNELARRRLARLIRSISTKRAIL